ncbi:MAG TPA: hypothetical protein O0X23_05180 [Methanocorpusculum sp.]|nr:hypothetical protein [Methanocorpusculum sp.]
MHVLVTNYLLYGLELAWLTAKPILKARKDLLKEVWAIADISTIPAIYKDPPYEQHQTCSPTSRVQTKAAVYPREHQGVPIIAKLRTNNPE